MYTSREGGRTEEQDKGRPEGLKRVYKHKLHLNFINN
jgi:hypothetical protein